MKLKTAEISIGVISILISLWFIINSLKMPDSLNKADVGPAYFPQMIAILLIIFCGVLILQVLFKKKDSGRINIKRYKYIFASIVSMIIYLLIIPYIGFYLATAIFFPALLFLASERNLKKIIFVTILFELLAFGVFENLLRVPLP